MRRSLTASLVALATVFACSGADGPSTPASPTPAPPAPVTPTWSVRLSGDVLEIAHGSGTSFPQYAAFHTASGYLRMNYGPGSGWGTSVVILPSLWTRGAYVQGARTSVTWATIGTELDVAFTADVAGLAVAGHVRFAPPAGDAIMASVTVTVSGSVALDARPGEAFKPVLLSSMHVGPSVWDTPSVFVGATTVQIPAEGWLLQPPVSASVFGTHGGTSAAWKTNAPAVEITMDRTVPVTGWMKRTSNPNDDNLALWWGVEEVLPAWQYRIRTFKQ